MKKLLIIFFTLLSLHSIGQGTFTANGDLAPTGSYPVTRFGSAQTGYWPLTSLAERDAIPAWQRTYGMMVYVKAIDSTYTLKSATLDNSNWQAFKQGSVDISNLVKYSDTASLSKRIDLNTTNLNVMLGSYVLSQRFLDSLTAIRSGIDLKLNIADTASLSNRINLKLDKTDTASLSYRIDQKFAISDTALLGNRIDLNTTNLNVMLGNTVVSQRFLDSLAAIRSGIDLKLNNTDTASLSNRIDQKFAISDTALLGNRIDLNTTNLNVMLGNTVVSQRFLDSLAAIRSGIDLKLNSADTVSLSNRIDQKFAISDTALLGDRISLKLDKTDTASLSNRIDLKLDKADTAVLANMIRQRVSYSDSTTTFITIKQLRDSLALIQSGTSGGGVNFNVDRVITRKGLPAEGTNIGAGKTVSQFLDAFFFPALAATPPTATFTASATFPYSTWKNWTSFGTTVNLNWGITNQSKLDNTDDQPITSIKFITGGTTVTTVTPDNSGSTQSGIFSNVPFINSAASKTAAFSQDFTFQVSDALPQTVTKTVTLTANPAVALSLSGLGLTPAVTSNIYEYTLADKTLALNWTVNQNDEAIVSQAINSAAVPSSPQNVILPIANPSTTYTVNVAGDIYTSGTSASITASWAKRLYCGVFTTALPPDDNSFAFTSAQTIGLPSTQLGGTWKTTTGNNFTFDGTGNQYLVFAYPTDNKAPEVDAFVTSLNSWNAYSAANLVIKDWPFTNQFGYISTYRYVFLNMSYKSTTLLIRLLP